MTTPVRDPNSVFRVVRLVATHHASWEGAAAAGIADLAKTIGDLRVARVSEMDVVVRDGQISAYRVKLEASYRIDRFRSTPTGDVVRVRRILVVANNTVGAEALNRALAERMQAGPAEFHVLVPANLPVWARVGTMVDPLSGFTGVDAVDVRAAEEHAQDEARARLATQLDDLRRAGTVATGEVGATDPMVAIAAVMNRSDFDEIIVSTLPVKLSNWLKRDLPARVARRFGIPVSHVETPA